MDRSGPASSYDSFREAVDVVEELTQTERIECDFNRSGRLGVAFTPQHLESMRATQRDLAENFDHGTHLLTRSELNSELGSDYYHGALLDPLSDALHVGKYVHGLAEAAECAGAEIHERNAATSLTRLPGGGLVVDTLNGTIRARPSTGTSCRSVRPCETRANRTCVHGACRTRRRALVTPSGGGRACT
ncbi:NAD(P)/FAD-dependent oxidoreductase [Streptomyces sp. NPDC057438]|uniref:NAD(P)/FAD-dependent oxidoreductase n=1 Tax=Streptomyces sp. NPDC057438 TaxID=3346133 RepID=UPI0036C37C4A